MMTKKSPFVSQPLQRGQIWEVANSNVLIGQVGKRLVHYKKYKNTARGVPSLLADKEDLERYFRENNAILVQE